MKKNLIHVIIGEAEVGYYLAINGTRVAGVKPFGCVVHEFMIDESRLRAALPKSQPNKGES